MGTKKLNEGKYRQLMNYEIENVLKKENIVRVIKAQRISWYAHVYRWEENEMIRKVAEWNPTEKRRKGRPKERWKEQVEKAMEEGSGNCKGAPKTLK